LDEKRLKTVPLFARLGKKERRALALRADEVDVPEGRTLAREGEFAYEFFVIEQGTAEVTRDGKHLGELGPGDFFGEIGILAQERRMATVTATSAMELIVLTSGAFRALDREEPDLAQRFRRTIEQRLGRDAARP
jgi:CRP-like cAMP-binding protein